MAINLRKVARMREFGFGGESGVWRLDSVGNKHIKDVTTEGNANAFRSLALLCKLNGVWDGKWSDPIDTMASAFAVGRRDGMTAADLVTLYPGRTIGKSRVAT